MPIDRNRLILLMGMTTSPFDNEALVALRKANALLASNNLTWQEFLAEPKPAAGDFSPHEPPRQGQHANADEINQLFDLAYGNARGSFRNFIDSLHEWWSDKHFLTARQYEALKRAARR